MLRSTHAAEMPVDDGLLEFLGSVDSDDKNWHNYLAGAGLDQVAAHPVRPGSGSAPGNPGTTTPPAAPPAAGASPPSTPPPAASPTEGRL
jgi:hypothetical protein